TARFPAGQGDCPSDRDGGGRRWYRTRPPPDTSRDACGADGRSCRPGSYRRLAGRRIEALSYVVVNDGRELTSRRPVLHGSGMHTEWGRLSKPCRRRRLGWSSSPSARDAASRFAKAASAECYRSTAASPAAPPPTPAGERQPVGFGSGTAHEP